MDCRCIILCLQISIVDVKGLTNLPFRIVFATKHRAGEARRGHGTAQV